MKKKIWSPKIFVQVLPVTQRTCNHHFSSFLGTVVLKFPGMFSAYQNSVSSKLSNICCKQCYVHDLSYKKSSWKLMQDGRNNWGLSYYEHCFKLL